MSDTTLEDIYSLDDLRSYIHQELCRKENLLPDQFTMTEMTLLRRNRECGLQFSLHGPRSVRLGAIWASDHNEIYLYDTQGCRYAKIRLRRRLHSVKQDEESVGDDYVERAAA
ncbi:MAG: hypothetical protein Tsb009_24020 [Planctomycetaceae bacterium]